MDSGTIQISGAGIKGPVAFADVKIFVLDASFPDYYDKTSPISTTITNQYAEIHGLSFPKRIKPPYILTIDGSNAIDVNTGVAPVIDTLITVVTDDMLASNRPVYATPLTTLAFYMARLNTEANSYKSNRAKNKAFNQILSDAASIVSSIFAVGQDTTIDLFRAPLVINDYTIDLPDQELAVYHRAAVEAFAAKVYTLHQNGSVTTDTLIQNLALDLHNDRTIDNADNGMLIGNIEPGILSQDSMEQIIPNTIYRIKDIMMLMAEERVLIGTNLGPTFLMDAISFPQTTSSTNLSDSISLSSTGIAGDQFYTSPLLIKPDSPGVIFYNNLDDEIQHTYTSTDLKENWGVTGTKDLIDPVEIVTDPELGGTHNNSMRISYAADIVGLHDSSGAQWTKKLSGYDELYVAYDVFFEDDAEFVKGGKLPRLQSTSWESNAGVPADGTDRWTAGLMWKQGGKLASYVYHADQSNGYGDIRYWDDGVDGQIYFQPGQWHTIEVRAVLNTPGVLDGRMQGWFDGKLAFDTNEFMWRMPGGEHLDIGEFMFVTFYGGGDSSWAPSTDQHIHFDNFVISTHPITH
jgi:hypothetical protein